ncbi:RNA polymerase sigma factor [Thermomonas brevis]|nr:sigma-70 family RNA polymerase sigma factor [Thermomonas brevis]
MEQTLPMHAAERERRFEALLERHRGILFKVAGTYCREPAEREDLMQDIAAQLWRAFPGYDEARAFPTWMYRIALNVAISSLRGRAHKQRDDTVALDAERHDAIGDAATAAETDERVRLLYRCIDRLDPLDRALLLLHLDERSQREIAEILGLTETNVGTKLGRLKQRLRNDLRDA